MYNICIPFSWIMWNIEVTTLKRKLLFFLLANNSVKIFKIPCFTKIGRFSSSDIEFIIYI